MWLFVHHFVGKFNLLDLTNPCTSGSSDCSMIVRRGHVQQSWPSYSVQDADEDDDDIIDSKVCMPCMYALDTCPVMCARSTSRSSFRGRAMTHRLPQTPETPSLFSCVLAVAILCLLSGDSGRPLAAIFCLHVSFARSPVSLVRGSMFGTQDLHETYKSGSGWPKNPSCQRHQRPSNSHPCKTAFRQKGEYEAFVLSNIRARLCFELWGVGCWVSCGGSRRGCVSWSLPCRHSSRLVARACVVSLPRRWRLKRARVCAIRTPT